MKLNLLPATVSRGRQTRTAWVVLVIVGVASAAVSILWMASVSHERDQAHDDYMAAQGPYQNAVNKSAEADTIISDPSYAATVRNVALANAMMNHNDDYPNLYNQMLRWVPPFYRITSISAQPISDTQASVTLVGTLKTYQQYADLMLALMRNPNAVSVSRSGYQDQSKSVPNLEDVDQTGRPRSMTDSPIPDNPLDRLAYFESKGAQQPGYTGTANFGSGTDATRGAMPDESLVTVQIVVNASIETPNPRQTLGVSGGAGGAGGFGAPGGPPPGVGRAGGGGGRPAGMPPGAGGPPPGAMGGR